MMKLSYLSPKTAISDSRIHGRGLFAKQDIKAGEIVAVKGGSILTADEWRLLEPSLGSAEIQIAADLFIAPADSSLREGSILYTNHSCSPNIGIQGQIIFVAMRDIAAGEELTHDWATTDDAAYQLQCRCGATECRRVITGKDWQKPEIQRKYRGWFAWHLQRKIDGLKAEPNQSA